MKRLMMLLVLLGMTTGLTSLTWADQSKVDAVDRLNAAANVLHEIMATPDKGIPSEVLDGAKCVAVVPHLIKGGLIFGRSTDVALLLAACPTGSGARRRSSPSPGGAGARRSARNPLTWS